METWSFIEGLLSGRKKRISLDEAKGFEHDPGRRNGNGFSRQKGITMANEALQHPAGLFATSSMATRKSFWRIILAACLVLAAGVGGVYVYFNFFQDSFRKLPVFPAESYFSDFKALSGIHYKVRGKVDASLGWDRKKGRLMAFRLEDDGRRIAILLPAAMNEREFSKGQDFVMEIEVADNGLLDMVRLQKE